MASKSVTRRLATATTYSPVLKSPIQVPRCQMLIHTSRHDRHLSSRQLSRCTPAYNLPPSAKGFPCSQKRSFTASASRSIFIQTEETPNADALKFRPNHPVLPSDFPSSFVEYLSPRSTLAAPHPSPLAAQLFNVEGVTSVFYGKDYITVTKDSGTPWPHVKPEVFSLITEAVTNGKSFVDTVKGKGEDGQASSSENEVLYDPEDEEVVGMIQELLETRIRPAIQEDGGDIEFRGFKEGQVLLKLRGACRTCDSSTVTLKNGIESMLMHYIEEVKGVQQIMDQEEEIAMKEFEKFEEKLKAQKDAKA